MSAAQGDPSIDLPPDIGRVLVLITDHHIGNFVIAAPVVNRLAAYFHQPVDVLVNGSLAELADALLTGGRLLALPRARGLRAFPPFVKMLSRIAGRYRAVIDVVGGVRTSTIAAATLAPRRIGLEWYPRRWVYNRLLPDDRRGHRLDSYARILACIGESQRPSPVRITITDSARYAADKALHDVFGPAIPRFAVIHAGAGKTIRLWPAERFVAVADDLMQRHGLSIALIGGPREQDRIDLVQRGLRHPDRAVRLTLPLVPLAAVLDRAEIFIGNESGPMHLATVTDCPIVAIFGPTPPEVWAPLRAERTVVLRGDRCSSRCVGSQCNADSQCLTSISVETVLAAVESVLELAANQIAAGPIVVPTT